MIRDWMNASRLTRIGGLIGAVTLAGAALATAQQRAPLQEELLHVRYPIHVEFGSNSVEDRLSYGNARQEKPEKATVAPRVRLRSKILGEPVFDVTEFLRKNGAALPESSSALFCPREELLYLKCTEDDLEMIRTMLKPFPADDGFFYTLDLQVFFQPAGKERAKVLQVKSVPMISGQSMSFRVEGETPIQFTLDPVVGPDTKSVVMAAETIVGNPGKSASISSAWEMEIAKERDVAIEKPGTPIAIFQLLVHHQRTYLGPRVLATAESKAEALKEISTALKNAGGVLP